MREPPGREITASIEVDLDELMALSSELEIALAAFEPIPESLRQELLGLFDGFLSQAEHCRLAPASVAGGDVAVLQFRFLGVPELRAAALRAINLHLGSAHDQLLSEGD